MHIVDASIMIVYLAGMVLVGVWFLRRNQNEEDYYVGGRKMGSLHVGLSVVATDVGGGFSIGLGGLGFAMGLSGSWLLFTGLLGALLSAAFLIPHLRRNEVFATAMTFPDLFREHYGKTAALVAATISAIGYLGFTSSQILAGTKLAGATFPDLNANVMLVVMGTVAVGYTVMGGLKAVVFTDTIQWAVLLLGLTLVGIPVCLHAVGGMEVVWDHLPAPMLSLSQLSWQKAVYWGVTVIPIWFVGMTLYQRIYACRDEKTARRAWLLAGLFEWPVMAFSGVFLGMLARTALETGLLDVSAIAGEIDPEQGLPMMLSQLLPVGVMGLLMSAYFSAILSTADSCLMAASGNAVSDILLRVFPERLGKTKSLRLSQLVTMVLGASAVVIAATMTSVLDLMLHSYAFMVSGLFVPVMGCLFFKRHNQAAAVSAMILGGGVTVLLGVGDVSLPYGLDANVFGIGASALVFAVMTSVGSRCQTTRR